MRLTIGVTLDADGVRAVGVRSGRVLWGVDGSVDPSRPLTEALAGFLGTLPVPVWPRPPVTVALGISYAQTKRLSGIPALQDATLLARAVQEHVGRFFLKNGVPLVTTSVRPDRTGGAWAAAFELTTVTAIEAACRKVRLPLRAVVPVVDVIGHGLVLDGRPVQAGGAAIEWENGWLASVRRVGRENGEQPAPVPALTSLGDVARAFAGAYGAAVSARTTSLAWRPVTPPPVPRWRLLLALSVGALALLAALVIPPLAAHAAERRAIAHLHTIATARSGALDRSRDLARTTEGLNEVADLHAHQRPATAFLAAVARALPPGAAALAMHIDSVSGSIVTLAPHASAVLDTLDRTPGIVGAEIVGPVTREGSTGHPLERATIRFRRGASR